jgi:hypothetical protein
VLNIALILEHLSNNFYHDGLAIFTDESFTQAGFPSWVRPRFDIIASHEEAHVNTLTSALQQIGAKPVEPCEYNLYVSSCFCASAYLRALFFSGFTDARTFVEESGTFEDIAAGVYTAGA